MCAETGRPSRVALALLLAVALLPACSGPEYSRAAEEPEIDSPALSTRLDSKDIDLALAEWVNQLARSEFVKGLPPGKPGIAILSFENATSEHISGALDTLLTAAETQLVQSNLFHVVDNTTIMRDAVLAERLRDAGDAVDKETAAALGKEFGIQYFVAGRVWDTTEKSDDVRRVQYHIFLRVTDVATLQLMHQTRVDVTKQENY
ncbi:MAG TPA: hypothetical protein VFY71_11610 [Planctomycetota bacterium]|nr:hypothetical protein [Planctomycetota bacterium]